MVFNMYKLKCKKENAGLLCTSIILTLILTMSLLPLKIHAADEGNIKLSKAEVSIAVGQVFRT